VAGRGSWRWFHLGLQEGAGLEQPSIFLPWSNFRREVRAFKEGGKDFVFHLTALRKLFKDCQRGMKRGNQKG
jgi:hypothetical protein